MLGFNQTVVFFKAPYSLIVLKVMFNTNQSILHAWC